MHAARARRACCKPCHDWCGPCVFRHCASSGRQNTICTMLNAVSLALASSLTFAQAAPSQTQAPGPASPPGRRTAARRSDSAAGGPPRPREIQGHHQGPHAVRRPPAGHRSQPRRRRLDRGAAQELWLSHRAHQVRVRDASEGHHGRRAARRAWAAAGAAPIRATSGRGRAGARFSARRRAPASTTIRTCSPTRSCAH